MALRRHLSALKPSDGFDKNGRLSGEAPRPITKGGLEQKEESETRLEKMRAQKGSTL